MSEVSPRDSSLITHHSSLKRTGISIVVGGVIAALAYVGGVWILRINMPGKTYKGALAPLTAEETRLRDELRSDIDVLAGTIGERNMSRYQALHEASEYLHDALVKAGYEVMAQEYRLDRQVCRNLEVEIRGTSKPDQIVIVGGHYDSVVGSPGANDNASGAAAVLALARRFAGARPPRTLRFVEFVNEEPPWSFSDVMGSVQYAKRCRSRRENVVAMFSLETMGFYSDAPRSQQYPFPLSLLYPNTANFIAFVGNTESQDLVRDSIATFRKTTRFPSEGGAVPGSIPGVGWSDHHSFWEQGYPGIMITDTALYRYAEYHTAEDTPEKVDYDRLARVVAGLQRVIEDAVK